jgi:hypothetical protein
MTNNAKHPMRHVGLRGKGRKCGTCKGTGEVRIATEDGVLITRCPAMATHRYLRYRRHYLRVFFARRGRALPRQWMGWYA